MVRQFLVNYDGFFDLTVVSRPQSASDRPRMATLEAALFESGRPVLLAPPTPLGTLGENILIAWNGTPEAARTVARSEEHTSELQSLMRISYAVFCLKKKKTKQQNKLPTHIAIYTETRKQQTKQ